MSAILVNMIRGMGRSAELTTAEAQETREGYKNARKARSKFGRHWRAALMLAAAEQMARAQAAALVKQEREWQRRPIWQKIRDRVWRAA